MAKETKTKPATPQYRVVGVVPGPIYFAGRNWDLAVVTLEQFDELHKLECPYVELIEAE